MSRYRHEHNNARLHIASLWGVIMLLSVFFAWALWGWSRAPQDLTFHVPPDLSLGAQIRQGEIPKPNVYAFAYYMWQQINRWPHDGAQDFSKNIYSFAAYVTPGFRADLIRDLEQRGRHGELAGRARALYEAPDGHYEETRVKQVGPRAWIVQIDAVVEETVAGLEVKRTRIRYPLRIVSYDVDRERNAWGLAIAGYAESGPTRLPEPKEASR